MNMINPVIPNLIKKAARKWMVAQLYAESAHYVDDAEIVDVQALARNWERQNGGTGDGVEFEDLIDVAHEAVRLVGME